MNTKTLLTALTATAALAAGSAQAATISWAVSDITGNITDVSTDGSLVDARAGSDLGTPDTVDGTTFNINGVTFNDGLTLDTPNKFDSIGTRAGSYTVANAAYLTLLQNADRDTDGNNDVTFTGLTIDNVYQIQVWAADTANLAGDRAAVLSDGSGSSATIGTAGHATLIFENGAEDAYGQFAIGTFTADAASQSFNVQHYNNLTTTATATTQLFLNAVQARDLGPVPEPGSLALLGLGGLLIARRRRG